MSAEAGKIRRISITDVAKAAGVSPATVSNALNRTRPVDPDTMERVTRAAKALGYVPNAAARSFRTGRANAIAVFSSMPAPVAAGPAKLGFLMEVAASAAEAALQHGLALVLVPPVPNAAEVLRDTGVDGALLIEPSADDPFCRILQDRNIPTVAIGDAGGSGLPCVQFDYPAMARMMLDHLSETGACNFLLVVGTSSRATHAAMTAEYLAHAHAIGMSPHVIAVDESEGEAGAVRALTEALKARPEIDGIMSPVDAFASGALQAIRHVGRRVPRDIRVITRYDGARAREAVPPLTALDLKLDRVARMAINRLIIEIAGGTGPVSTPAPLPRLIARLSTLQPCPEPRA